MCISSLWENVINEKQLSLSSTELKPSQNAGHMFKQLIEVNVSNSRIATRVSSEVEKKLGENCIAEIASLLMV